MKIDLLCVWPDVVDYPLFRRFLQTERKRFHKVFIVWTQTNWDFPLVKKFVEASLSKSKITFLESEPVKAGQDWRSVATNTALKVSDSEWVYFTEQDFTPLAGFWKEVEDLVKRTEVFGRFQGDRLHPSCLFIKRSLLDKTSRDFGAYPESGLDHFGKVQQQIEKKAILGVIFPRYGKHLNGLTHNIHLLMQGEPPNYEVEEFKKYIKECLESGIEMPKEQERLFRNGL